MLSNCGVRQGWVVDRVEAQTTRTRQRHAWGRPSWPTQRRLYTQTCRPGRQSREKARTIMTRRSASTGRVVKLATLLLSAGEDVGTFGAEGSATDVVDTVACQKSAGGNGADCVRTTVTRTTNLRSINELMLHRLSPYRRRPPTPVVNKLCVKRKGLVLWTSRLSWVTIIVTTRALNAWARTPLRTPVW